MDNLEHSEDTLINEDLLSEESNDSQESAEVATDVDSLQAQLDKAKEQARLANIKIEYERKNEKKVVELEERLKKEYDEKLKSSQDALIATIAQELTRKDQELDDLKKIVGAKTSETPNLSSSPVMSGTSKRSDGLDQSKIDHYKSLLK